MRIKSFRIENFRNLRLVECSSVPTFMVICGANGCGKSALLEAIMTAKEHAGGYGNFAFDPRAVSVNAEMAKISLVMEFSAEDQAFLKRRFNDDCPDSDEIVVELTRGGGGNIRHRSTPTHHLLGHYSRSDSSPFFDFIGPYREIAKSTIAEWRPEFMADEAAKGTLALGQNKFQLTKRFLAGLKIRDLQAIQTLLLSGGEGPSPDSLAPLRQVFNDFFAPMKFHDVYIQHSPFAFVIETPLGNLDIDDLSSGEKEILNIFVRFHQLNPRGSIILFDEADAHLHPDLERRYLESLKKLSNGNQVILTTHSPEMMIAAGSESLYTLAKQPAEGLNQLARVTARDDLHQALTELMGSRGLISFNQRIVFIEGVEASADREIYEALYPPVSSNVSFVPAGDSSTVRKTAERVNELLSASVGFQQFFSIVDRDIVRAQDAPVTGGRLFRLPVYHVENFLLEPSEIFEVTQQLLRSKCPFSSIGQVESRLKELVLQDTHLKAFAGARFDAEVASIAKIAHDGVFKRETNVRVEVPEFQTIEAQARKELDTSIAKNTWRADCKARELLRSYCGQHGIKYEQFRNLLISRLKTPPEGLRAIMSEILR